MGFKIGNAQEAVLDERAREVLDERAKQYGDFSFSMVRMRKLRKMITIVTDEPLKGYEADLKHTISFTRHMLALKAVRSLMAGDTSSDHYLDNLVDFANYHNLAVRALSKFTKNNKPPKIRYDVRVFNNELNTGTFENGELKNPLMVLFNGDESLAYTLDTGF